MIDQFVDEYVKGILASTLGVEAEVNLLRERHPHLDPARLADRIVGEAVTKSGQLGVVLGAVTLVPVLGSWLMVGVVAADASLLMREQLAMLIKLGFLYEPQRTRAARESDAVLMMARFAAEGETPTSAVPTVIGHFARQSFKHLARRLLHRIWKKVLSGWFSIPLSLLISAKVDRDSTAELGEFAALELERANR